MQIVQLRLHAEKGDGTTFERFTDRARRVVVLAQEEARILNHNYIGTEHVLLGLLHEGEGIAAKSLTGLGLSLDGVRARCEQIIGRGQTPPEGHIPFTPRAKKVFELSLREALQLGHNYIGTEHLLLGLIREGEGVAAQVLVYLGGELPRYRQEVIRQLSGTPGSSAAGDDGHAKRKEALASLEAKILASRSEVEDLIDAQDFAAAADARERTKEWVRQRDRLIQQPLPQPPTIRTFLMRSVPSSEVHDRSGIQLVAAGVTLAEGAEFSDGRIALRWVAAPQSSIWLDNRTQMEAVFPNCIIDWRDQ